MTQAQMVRTGFFPASGAQSAVHPLNNSTIAYKLVRMRKDGTLGPMFIQRGRLYKLGVKEIASFMCTPPHGFTKRPGFHCCTQPRAPHIKLKLKNGERRVWCEVEVEDYTEFHRPECQGGTWLLAKYMTILRVLQ